MSTRKPVATAAAAPAKTSKPKTTSASATATKVSNNAKTTPPPAVAKSPAASATATTKTTAAASTVPVTSPKSPLHTIEWLQHNSLRAQRLDLHRWLPAIGFRHCEEYVEALARHVESAYSTGLFDRVPLPDGTVLNVALDRKKVVEYEAGLRSALAVLRARLDWLTSRSLLVFGRPGPAAQGVAVVLVLTTLTPTLLPAWQRLLADLLAQQLAHVPVFNLLRATAMVTDRWKPGAVAGEALSAHAWLMALAPLARVDKVDILDAFTLALNDPAVDTIMLVIDHDGAAAACSQVLLKQARASNKVVHVATVNVRLDATLAFAKSLARDTHGLFHAFSGSLDDAARNTGLGDCTADSEEIVALRVEINYCLGIMASVKALLMHYEEHAASQQALAAAAVSAAQAAKEVDASLDLLLPVTKWLAKHGHVARKLTLSDGLRPLSHPHVAANVGILRTSDDAASLSALKVSKAKSASVQVHAIMCRMLPHYRWFENSIVHLSILPLDEAMFLKRVHEALEGLEARIQAAQDKAGTSASFLPLAPGSPLVLVFDTSSDGAHRLAFAVDQACHLLREQTGTPPRHVLLVAAGAAGPDRVDTWPGEPVECAPGALAEAESWLRTLQPAPQPFHEQYGDTSACNVQYAVKYALQMGAVPKHPPPTVLVLAASCTDANTNTSNTEDGNDVAPITGAVHMFALDTRLDAVNVALRVLARSFARGSFHFLPAHFNSAAMAVAGQAALAQLVQQRLPGMTGHSALTAVPSDGPLHPDLALLWADGVAMQTAAAVFSAIASECRNHELVRRAGRASEIVYCLTEPPPPPPPPPSKVLSKSEIAEPDDKTAAAKTGRPAWDKYSKPGRSSHLPVPELDISKPTNTSKPIVDTIGLSSTLAWLAKNSLAARGLTLDSVLADTAVAHRGKYVPILDKTIYAKVFEGVLVCDPNNENILVNTRAARLDAYEKQVGRLRTQYWQRLRGIVAAVLPRVSLLDDNEPESLTEPQLMAMVGATAQEKALREWMHAHPVFSGHEDALALLEQLDLSDAFLTESGRLRAQDEVLQQEQRRQRAESAKMLPVSQLMSPGSTLSTRGVVLPKRLAATPAKKQQQQHRFQAVPLQEPELDSVMSTADLVLGNTGAATDPSMAFAAFEPKAAIAGVKPKGQPTWSLCTHMDELPLLIDSSTEHDATRPVLVVQTSTGYFVPGMLEGFDSVTKLPMVDTELGVVQVADNHEFVSLLELPDPLYDPQLHVGAFVLAPGTVNGVICFAPATVVDIVDGDLPHTHSIVVSAFNGQQNVFQRFQLLLLDVTVHTAICQDILQALRQQQSGLSAQLRPATILAVDDTERLPLSLLPLVLSPPPSPPSTSELTLAAPVEPKPDGKSVMVLSQEADVQLAVADQNVKSEPTTNALFLDSLKTTGVPISNLAALGQHWLPPTLLHANSVPPSSLKEASALPAFFAAPKQVNCGPEKASDALGSADAAFDRTLAVIALPLDGTPSNVDRLMAMLQQHSAHGVTVLVATVRAQLTAPQARELYLGEPDDGQLAAWQTLLTTHSLYVAVLQGSGALGAWRAVLNGAAVNDSATARGSASQRAAEHEIEFFFGFPGGFGRATPFGVPSPKNATATLAGQSALGQWDGDGWFYRCVVVDRIMNTSVCVRDSGLNSRREARALTQLVVLSECPPVSTQGQAVLVLHPLYEDSYAPGLMVSLEGSHIEIQLYDGSVTSVPSSECFGLADPSCYPRLVAGIEALEKSLVGRRAVLRCDEDGLFYEGVVGTRLGNGHEYEATLDDGLRMSYVEAIHVFTHEVGRPQYTPVPGDSVIGLYYTGEAGTEFSFNIYAPGQVTDNLMGSVGQTVVRFYDGAERCVPTNSLYSVGTEYFSAACAYIAQQCRS